MMNQSTEKVREVMNDKAFVTRVLQMEEPVDVQKAFADKGVELTLGQVEAIGKAISRQGGDDEISVSELEGVSGGIALETIIVIVGGLTIAVKIGTAIKNSGWKW